MSTARLRRGLRVATVAGLLALTATFGAGAAPAQPEPDQAAIDAAAQQLPQGLQDALRRDLGVDARTYLATERATRKSTATGQRLRQELGGDFGGFWFEPGTSKLHVAVVTEAAAGKVQQAGAQPHVRPVTEAKLAKAVEAITDWTKQLAPEQRALVYGATADVPGGQVKVTLADSEPGRALAGKVPAAGVTVKADHARETPRPPSLRGGDGYFALAADEKTEGVCSLGFNAVDKSGRALGLTAGHCALMFAQPMKKVFSETDESRIGEFERTVWDSLDRDGHGDDYATIRITNPTLAPLPEVTTYGRNADGKVVIDSVGEPVPGAQVCKSGRTSKWTCGTVFSAKAVWTVAGRDQQRVQSGFEYHGACVEGGDSGGAIVAGTAALGWSSSSYFSPTSNRCYQVPGPDGPTYKALGESLASDVLPDFGPDLHVLTSTGDLDKDGVRDIDELAANRTEVKDANSNGIAAYRDPDEPVLRAPEITAPANGSRFTDTKPGFRGTAKPNAGVSVKLDGVDLPRVTADRDGNWAVSPAKDLALGGHELVVRQQIGSGSPWSAQATSGFTVIPATPVILEPKDHSAGENTKPRISGTGKAKALVTVAVDKTSLGEVTVGEDGTWRLLPETDLRPGVHVITAKQTVTAVDSDAAQVTYEVKGAPSSSGKPSTPQAPGGAARDGNPGAVPGAAPADGDKSLAFTGVALVVPLVLGGALIVGAGVVLLVRFRRRKAA